MTPQGFTGHGAFVALSPEAREIVPRRMTMRDDRRPIESRRAAAEWLASNGTAPDRREADLFLRGRRYA